MRTLPHLTATTNSIMPLVVTKEQKKEFVSVLYYRKTQYSKIPSI
jgi:hypothetical protein